MSGVAFGVDGVFERVVPIAKAEPKLQMAWGVVMEPRGPDDPDSQGDWYTAEEITKAMFAFADSVVVGTGFSDLMHDEVTRAGWPRESWQFRDDGMLGDQVVKAGSWVIGMYYPDPDVWGRIVKGELNAFSVGGRGTRIFDEVAS